MILKHKILLCYLLGSITVANAQLNQYQYQRPIDKISTTWHSINLPSGVFGKTQPDLSDLRIYGFKGRDTIEVPYLLKIRSDQVATTKASFKLINQVSSSEGFYYTLYADKAQIINEITLSFKEDNFDWKVTLTGSDDNRNWFTIGDDFRLVGIKNDDADYKFTKLTFKSSTYRYYRLLVKGKTQPNLVSAETIKTDTIKGAYNDVPYKLFELKSNLKAKETQIELVLPEPAPLAALILDAENRFDFYRNFKVEFATDSINTDKGIQYNYTELFNGVLSSFDKHEFSFDPRLCSRLKLTIYNEDNAQLWIRSIKLKAVNYQLIARFDNPGYQYLMVYGNANAVMPNYELVKLEGRIPAGPTAVIVGNETKNPQFTEVKTSPLFQNKMWMWALMILIIALLVWFSFGMLKKTQKV